MFNGKTFDKEIVLDGSDPEIQKLLFKHGFHWGGMGSSGNYRVREFDQIKVPKDATRLFKSGKNINMSLGVLKAYLVSTPVSTPVTSELVGRKITRGGKHVYIIESNGDTSRLAVLSTTNKGIPANSFEVTDIKRHIREGTWAFVDETVSASVVLENNKALVVNSEEMQDYLFSQGYRWAYPPKEGIYKLLGKADFLEIRSNDKTIWNGKYCDNTANPVTLEQLQTQPINKPIIQETPMSNTLSKYSNVNFSVVVLFRGQCVKDFNKETFMSLIRQLNDEIASYSDIENSVAVADIVTGLKKDRAELTAIFDIFMKG